MNITPGAPALGPEARIKEIAEALKKSRKVDPVTVRQFLGWFEAERRTLTIVARIREALATANLATKPDFQYAYIDETIAFLPASGEPAQEHLVPVEPSAFSLQSAEIIRDPSHRIGKLPSANVSPVRVTPNTSLSEAITIMLSHDFSQLPVMTSDRDVKGVISWASVASRLALGVKCEEVRQCMESAHIIGSDAPVFDTIDSIMRHQYVLVRDATGKIVGIVTSSDLAAQFKLLAEPFLLLGAIENGVRWIIESGKFTTEEIATCKVPSDGGRKITRVADFTLGECRRFLEEPKNWDRTGLAVDRKTFIRLLERVIRIRNDVMHFDPDGVSPDGLNDLQHFAAFLQTILAYQPSP